MILVRSLEMTTLHCARLPVFPSTLIRSLRYFSKEAISRTLSSTGAAQSMTNLTVDFFADFPFACEEVEIMEGYVVANQVRQYSYNII